MLRPAFLKVGFKSSLIDASRNAKFFSRQFHWNVKVFIPSSQHSLVKVALKQSVTGPFDQRHLAKRLLRSSSSSSHHPTNSSPLSHSPKSDSVFTFVKSLTQFNVSKNGYPLPSTSPLPFDPLHLVAGELKSLAKQVRCLLGSGHPLLDRVAKYYTLSEGKFIRPTLVLLISRAASYAPKKDNFVRTNVNIDTPISRDEVLVDTNPLHDDLTSNDFSQTINSSVLDSEYSSQWLDRILPSQRRLAEITELIHTASLLHDDVIDDSCTRRNQPSAKLKFGNKMAVLAGDFLLGRASMALARLRNPEVTELLASVIANLVEGEFMQLKHASTHEAHPVWSEEALAYYLQKTYLKSASLISKSCRAASLLGQASPDLVERSYEFGKNLGLAFQLVDDLLDYTHNSEDLGKPAGSDLRLGLVTAPILFAWRDNHALGELIGRKFSRDGDVEKARTLVMMSGGLEQTRSLARDYTEKAIQALNGFPESDGKAALIEMCHLVLNRRK